MTKLDNNIPYAYLHSIIPSCFLSVGCLIEIVGKGIYLVDKIKNPNSEMNIIGHEVDTSKIFDATGDANIKNLRSDSNLRKQLIDQGYNGVRVEDKVMLFPETMPKEK